MDWSQWEVGLWRGFNGAAELEPSYPPMVQLSWNLPLLQWCSGVGTFLLNGAAANLAPIYRQKKTHLSDHLSHFFPLVQVSILLLNGPVTPFLMRHSLLTLSLFLFLSFLSFSLFLSLFSLASCQNFCFSNGLLLSFFLYVLFFFLLHWCGCSLQSVPPLLPWTQPHTPSMYMLKPFLSTCHNRLWKFIFSFIRKMPLSSILAKI